MKKESIFTPGYTANAHKIIRLLNEARAREIVAYLEYKYFEMIMEGRMMEDMQELMKEHASQELGHAERLGFRVNQLLGDPINALSDIEKTVKKFGYEFKPTKNYTAMLKDLLEKERIAIDGYRELVKLCAFNDPVTRKLAEDALGDEEHHADEIYNLLKGACSSG